jgi:hypothetical protein
VSGSTLARIADLFVRAEVEYAVIGAHGVNAWLEPRFTADIDVTAGIDPAGMLRLRRVFADAGYELTLEYGGQLPSGPDFVRFASADRPKDRQDLLGLVALPDLDWAHVERWAAEWDVADRLASLRRDASR